jgi:hypothetical protein
MIIKEKLADNLYYYKKVIKDPEALIAKIESLNGNLQNNSTLSNWSPWVSSTRPDDVFGEFKAGGYRIGYDLSEHKESFLIIAEIHDAILKCIEDYAFTTQKDLGYLPDEITIRKYHAGGKMGPHIDCEEDDDEARLTASLVLYLNDNFEGGDVIFREQGINIKPEPGSLLIFPSVKPYYHESTEITSGYKYMCPAFMFKRSKLN